MYAKDIITESADQRSKIQKLQDLISHPNTEATIKAVALEKLQALGVDITQYVKTPRVLINTNLTDNDFQKLFVGNLTCDDIYTALLNLKPPPNTLHFLSQGVIHMFVPPPYMGLTKQQYIYSIKKAVPAAKISDKFLINVAQPGYLFTISFL